VRQARLQLREEERRLFFGLANNLVAGDTCKPHAVPLGQPHPDWPIWTKPVLADGKPRVLGCAEFVGDEPYDAPTPSQINDYHDFELSADDIRCKSNSVRAAIAAYLPSELFFGAWLPRYFTTFMDRPAHFWGTYRALESIPRQFNLREPWYLASAEMVETYLHKGSNMARDVLAYADTQSQARDHPELLLAMAMFQASHRCFIDQLNGRLEILHSEGLMTDEQRQISLAVTDGPFRQFDGFIIFATLLNLVLPEQSKLAAAEPSRSYEAVTEKAIGRGWDSFIELQILRHDFDGGRRMICPANQHLRYAKESKALEGLFQFVCNNRDDPGIRHLLAKARQAATSGAYAKTQHYIARLRDQRDFSRNARGGLGLARTA